MLQSFHNLLIVLHVVSLAFEEQDYILKVGGDLEIWDNEEIHKVIKADGASE